MPFKYVAHIKEEHNNPIFGVRFNDILKDEGIFATVGSNRVTVYKCEEDGVVKALQAYKDANVEECYYTCTWSYNKTNGHSLLAVGGALGIVRVINTTIVTSWKSFSGHGNAVNELKTHPLLPHLILSASKDHSLRLWNIQSDVCVAIFGGLDGHRDEVLGADFHMLGGSIVSCGMDHALKIWQLDTGEMKEAIEKSGHPTSQSSMPTLRCYLPSFSTREVHCNYVDSVCYHGNTVLSKSCENCVVWWKPTNQIAAEASQANPLATNDVMVFRRLEVSQCEIWFMKMCFNDYLALLVLGNQVGKITVWDMRTEDATKSKLQVLSHNKCNTAVRHVSVSKNGRHLISVCDNATVWRWDHKTSCDTTAK